MIEELRTWVISICTAVIFITAVEMILPNNNLKKYAKFVLGLILITVLINPIIKIFDKNFNIDDYTSKAVKYFDEKDYEQDLNKYKESSMINTLNTFKLNLENECEKKLKEEFPKNNYEVEASVSYDKNNDSVSIDKLKVKLKEGTVKKIKKVEVNTKDNSDALGETLNSKMSTQIKKYLKDELNVPADAIEVYKD